MTCRKMESNIADLLFDPDRVSAAVKAHVAECGDCENVGNWLSCGRR